MLWSDDVRCLHCNRKLPLYRKITNGQFCSTGHRKLYWEQQGQLAVERLTQTHNSLKTLHPPISVASILGRDQGEAAMGGFVPAVLYPQAQGAPQILVADPLAYDLERAPGKLEWIITERPERIAPSAGPMRLLQEWSSHCGVADGIEAGVVAGTVASPRGVEIAPRSTPFETVRPRLQLSPLLWTEESIPASAGLVGFALFPIGPSTRKFSPQPLPSRAAIPALRIELPFGPATPEMEPRTASKIERQPPAAVRLLSLTAVFQRGPRIEGPADASPQTAAAEPIVPAALAAFPDARGIELVGFPQPAGAVRLAGAQAVAPGKPLQVAAFEFAPAAPVAVLPEHEVVETARLLKPAGMVRWVGARVAVPQKSTRTAFERAPAAPLALLPGHGLVKSGGLSKPAGMVPLAGAQAVAPGKPLYASSFERAPATPLALLPTHEVVRTFSLAEVTGAVRAASARPAVGEKSIKAVFECGPAVPLPLLPEHRVVTTTCLAVLAGAVRSASARAAAPEKPTQGAFVFASAVPLALLPEPRVVKEASLSELAAPVRPVLAECEPSSRVPAASVAAAAFRVMPQPSQASLVLNRLQASPAMGQGSRYPIQVPAAGRTLVGDADPMEFTRPAAGIPGISLTAWSASLGVASLKQRGTVPLKIKFGAPATKPIKPIVSNIATIPQPLRTEPLRPSARLQPISDLMQAEVVGGAESGISAWKTHPWTKAAGSWKQAPRNLKILAFAIPALLALAFHQEVHVAATTSSTGELRSSLRSVVDEHWSNLRQAVVARAAVALNEDFRSGLDDWGSRSDATADWSFDTAGFVQPGPLALYRPSMGLTNYQMQFLGRIDKKAMSWVVRAADFDNYYVLKLVVLKPGPRTTVGLTRYAVIDGKAVDRVDAVVPIEAQPDTLYRVNMELDGDKQTLTVQGQLVDSWSEPRLPRGGIGFFTARGEVSHIRWVALTHQYDMLGRLCAYLAPYQSPTNGSW